MESWNEFRQSHPGVSFRAYLKRAVGKTSHLSKKGRNTEIDIILRQVGLTGNFGQVCRLLNQGVHHTKGRYLIRYGKVAKRKGQLMPLSAVLRANHKGHNLNTIAFV